MCGTGFYGVCKFLQTGEPMTNTQNSAQMTEVSLSLPFDIRAALVRAAAITDPLKRLKAIEEAERMGRLRFPEKFKPEVVG